MALRKESPVYCLSFLIFFCQKKTTKKEEKNKKKYEETKGENMFRKKFKMYTNSTFSFFPKNAKKRK